MPGASVSIRLNPFKGCDGPAGRQVPWSPYGRILDSRPGFTLDPLFHAGCYYVQDSSAMYVGHVFRKLLSGLDVPSDGPRVLDLCAAPGGKTTDIAASLRESFGSSFLVVSNEVMKSRAGVLRDNVAVWGDPNVAVCSADPGAFSRLRGFFDIIVADVPCSGEGMFRKDPRAEAEWSPAVVDLCAARQRRILSDVWPALRDGGLLIYSTCTYEESENDANLEWAARELGGDIIPPVDEFSAYGVSLTAHGYLLRAGVVPGEGQWAGALRKVSGQRRMQGAGLDFLHPVWPAAAKGMMKGRDFVPYPDYALSLAFDMKEFPCVEADLPTALKFLHRDALVLPEAAPGYNVICYGGHPLGFVKNIGTRCNNLMPKSRRIMMNV